MARSSISKTLGPIHFEDLDPHRFEDLVRELAYDFKDWQSIEATGRSGADDGIDIRAYEQVTTSPTEHDDGDSDDVTTHPMEGNVWFFQCKREKAIGPTKVATIVSDGVNSESPPYGYIIAAPANFSKASYDKFREELRERGVMEFYLWGRAELEDMLHLPKNDHILFTFFGISLVSRRKSRATEIRAAVSAKNKLLKHFGFDPAHEPVLLRDTKDDQYPYEKGYKDFNERPRWSVYPVIEIHPMGIIVEVAKHFAFYGSDENEYDYTDALNLVHRQVSSKERQVNHELRINIESFCELFQKSHQAMYIKKGLVRFDSIVLIDDKGSSQHKFPHIYVDFQGDKGPFVGFNELLEYGNNYYTTLDDLKRTKKFPKKFSKPRIGKVYRGKSIDLYDRTRHFLETGASDVITIYDCDDKFQFLNQTDVIGVKETRDHDGDQILIKVTNKRQELGKDLLKEEVTDPVFTPGVEEQLGRKLNPDETIIVYEFKKIFKWQVEEK
jgi:hypothetical protein